MFDFAEERRVERKGFYDELHRDRWHFFDPGRGLDHDNPSSNTGLVCRNYTDAPRGQPGYALIAIRDRAVSSAVWPSSSTRTARKRPSSRSTGKAVSTAPFTLSIKGDRAANAAQAQVMSGSVITIQNCAQLFAPAVPVRASGDDNPPAPASCEFGYKLAPGAPRQTSGTPTNLTASPDIKNGLLNAFLFETGFQSQYSADISLGQGTTYVAYDPTSGLDWAYASFDYNGGGPDPDGSGSPGVGECRAGATPDYFYQIPGPGASFSPDDGWVMVGIAGEPICFSRSVLPTDVVTLWGLSDNPSCTS